ncbi:MAG: Peptidase M28 [uncultured Segetibacter sp.]|uniref:Peptidase M28 n=1 Tax=uncultured Segetibacter sp. TaxID=481133 RepID=A0A6J4TQJ3_9BACT|nr:MAG: Peptidase M28 [uncultured Segetibacter sp.]
MPEFKFLYLRKKVLYLVTNRPVEVLLHAGVIILMFLFAFTAQPKKIDPDEGLAAFSADSLAKHIAVLASDEFEGRKPFTRAEIKTINYLRNQFKALALEPGNGRSYFQEVPMVNIATAASPEMRVNTPDSSFTLKGFDDYVLWTDKTDKKINVDNAEVIFAGYGVVAPEYKWNDYEGLDVKGKIVLVMVNDPGFGSGDTSLFKGKTMTYYGRWTYKFEEAARQGAKGCLIIYNTAAAGYPFSVIQNNWNSSRLHLDNRGKNEKNCDVIGWVSGDAARRLLLKARQDTLLLAKAHTRTFKAVPLPLKLTTSMLVEATYKKSHNVLAKIKGTTRPAEYIIYSAHWDHLGFGKADEKGDSIYNGALDNASGTAGLLELARVFKTLKTKPERTIVFLSVTAEEQGLWGSAYYAENPVYPPAKTVANINMDGLNAFEKTKDVIIVGKGQSELEDYLQDAAQKSGRYIAPEPHPEAGGYYRSDHFNFAKAGIPALYTKYGIDVEGKGKEYGQKQHEDFNKNHYHRPSDEYNSSAWTMAGGLEDLKLLFEVGKRLSYETRMPEWKDGSEFKAIRQKSFKKS